MTLSFRVSSILIFVFLYFGLLAQNPQSGHVKMEVDSLRETARLIQEAEDLKAEKKWAEALEKYDEASMLFFENGDIANFELCNAEVFDLTLLLPLNNYLDFCKKKIQFCELSFGKEDPQTALWNLQLGKLMNKNNRIDGSELYINKSLAIFKESQNRRKEVLYCRHHLEFILIEQGQFLRAENSINKTLNLIQSSLDSNLISTSDAAILKAESFLSLGSIMIDYREDEKIIQYCNAAIAIAEKENAINILIKAHSKISIALMLLNDYKQAEEYILKAINYTTLKYGEDSSINAKNYNKLGLTRKGMRQYDEALKLLNKALTLEKKYCGELSFDVYLNMVYIGQAYIYKGEFQKADSFLNKALKIGSKIYPDENAKVIFGYLTKCQLWISQSTNVDSTAIFLNKIIAINKAYFGDNHPEIAQYQRHLAYISSVSENYEKALLHLQKALIANSYQFKNLSISANPDQDDYIIEFEGLFALKQKAEMLFLLWKKDKNNTDLLEQINSCSNSIYSLLTKKSKNLGEGLAENAELLNRLNWFVFDNIATNYELFGQTEETHFLENYYRWMEKLKGQILLLAFQKSAATKYGNIPTQLVEQDYFLSSQIDSLTNLLQRAIKQKDTYAIAKIKEVSLLDARRKRELFIADLEENFPSYYQLKYDLEPLSLADLQKELEENTLYVELSINYQENPRALYFLTLTNNDQHIFKTSLSKDYIEKITTFNKLLRSHNLIRADRRRKFIDLSNELYQQYIQPIAHLLEDKEKLVIIGDDVTYYLPIEALLKSKEDKPWQELDFLIRDHEISYHYSGTLFARSQKQEKEFDNELLAFAPVFSKRDNNTLAALRTDGLVMADSTFRTIEGDIFSPLPYSEKEVKNIQKLFPKSANTKILLNENASEKNLKAALEKNHRFIHIASHSFSNIDFPKFSGIACMTDSTSTTDEGILYVGEIYNLAVNSDLVVLSSCESGVGKLLEGEGMLGLNRSFVYAGVPNVIFSLWKVYDENTGELMTEFYKNTLQGQSYSKALRSAKLKMLANPETAAPDIWAAFLLVGR